MLKLKKSLALLLTLLLLSFSACAENKTPADNSTPTESNISQTENDYQPTVKPDGSITLKPAEDSDSSSSATAPEKML